MQNLDRKIAPCKITPPERLPPKNPPPGLELGFGLGLEGGRQFSRGQFSIYRVKCTKAFAEFAFFHGECVNLTISQQQLELLIKYSKLFRRAIVNICTCKGDFLKSYFLQRDAFSEDFKP